MVITDKFVFLHLPKTGGIFVTEILKRVQSNIKARNPHKVPFFLNLMTPNTQRLYAKFKENQHGAYEQIPEEYRDRPVFAVMRNPFDRYVSIFEYGVNPGGWRYNPYAEEKAIRQEFPNFPDLTFKDYLRLENSFGLRGRPYHDILRSNIGLLTFQFIQMFFKDPGETFRSLNDEYVNSDRYKEDMPEIIFLRMENLNRDLYHILLKFGYAVEDISFILNAEKIHIKSTTKLWEEYYTEDLIQYVSYKERFLFRLFPEYVVSPPAPLSKGVNGCVKE
jgi:hypothetical protein